MGALGVLAAIAIGLGVASPAMADSDGNINVELNDVGTFEYHLWYAGGVNLSAADVTTLQGATSTGVTVLSVSDTRTNSPGWTLYLSATDFTDGQGHSIPNTGFSLTEPNNANLSCPGTAVPSNPFQVLTRGTQPVNLSTQSIAIQATAGRGCANRDQQLNLTLVIPAGSYATDYTSVLTLTDVAA
jgi:hypothetical protein